MLRKTVLKGGSKFGAVVDNAGINVSVNVPAHVTVSGNDSVHNY